MSTKIGVFCIILGMVMMAASIAMAMTVAPSNDLATGIGLGLLVAGIFSGFAGLAGAMGLFDEK